MALESAYNGCSCKKVNPTTRTETAATFMLRCAELGLHTDDLEDMTMGMVYDMLIEQANDREKYPIKGRTGTLKDFLKGGGDYGRQD